MKEYCKYYQFCKWGDICSNALTDKVLSEFKCYGKPLYKMENKCKNFIKK